MNEFGHLRHLPVGEAAEIVASIEDTTARAEAAFLTDDLLAHTVDKWTDEVAAADVLRLWDGGDLDD